MGQKRLMDDEYNGVHNGEEGLEEFLFDLTAEEVREVLEFLIAQRQHLKEEELCRLEEEAGRLATSLGDVQRRKLRAELECFREVLRLQRRLLEHEQD